MLGQHLQCHPTGVLAGAHDVEVAGQPAQYVIEDGRYFEAFPDEDGVYHSTAMPGFWLRLSWLWEEEPRALAAWTEIAATIPKPPTK